MPHTLEVGIPNIAGGVTGSAATTIPYLKGGIGRTGERRNLHPGYQCSSRVVVAFYLIRVLGTAAGIGEIDIATIRVSHMSTITNVF
jgi:hypothetical protein